MTSTSDRAALATSAVVVGVDTARRWHDVRAVLAALAAQDHHADQVLLVVDHAPGLAVRARGFFSTSVQVIENRRRAGLAGSRNGAIDALTESRAGLPEVVAFLDDDAVPHPDWLARMLAPFEDPAVAAVAGTARPRGAAGAGGPIVAGGSLAVRRDGLVATGGFGEGPTRPDGADDVELRVRLRHLLPGSRIVVDPDAVVDQPRPTTRARCRLVRHLTSGAGYLRGRLATP